MNSELGVEIAVQKDAIALNAFDYKAFCRLLQALKTESEQSGSNESRTDLELHRELFQERFLPDSTFWLDWIEERISCTGSSADDMNRLDDLFNRALSNCASVEIAKEWIDNMFHRHEAELMDDSAIQMFLENTIKICGGDIMDGASLWNRLIDIHLNIIEDLVDTTANDDNIRNAKEALVSTYRRQFALPLLGNQRSLSNFEKDLSDICVESDEQWIKPEMLLDRFKRSEEQLQARILYEQNVLSEDFQSANLNDQVAAWKTYIRFEIEEKQVPRAHRLYERSLITSHQSVELWLDYADFAENTLKQWDLVESVTGRAVKVHRSNIELWLLYLLAIESCSPDSALSGTPAHITSKESRTCVPESDTLRSKVPDDIEKKLDNAVKTAMTCSFYEADHYLAILLYSCDYRRRKLQRYMQTAPAFELSSEILVSRATVVTYAKDLRLAFAGMESFLDACYPEWGAGWLQVYKYQTSIEDEIITDIAELFENGTLQLSGQEGSVDMESYGLASAAGDVWERAVHRFSKYHFMWGEYIQWGRSAGDYDLCRTLYRRALKAVRDLPEETCKACLLFEQQVGNLNDFCIAKARTKTIMKNASLKALKAVAVAKEEAKAKTLKRSSKAAATVAAAAAVSTAITGRKDASESLLLGSSTSFSDRTQHMHPHAGLKRSSDEQAASRVLTEGTYSTTLERDYEHEGPAKRPKAEHVTPHPTPAIELFSAAASTTITVKNLSFSSTIEEIMDHFQPCGTVINGQLVLSKAGKSRGQALIEFSDSMGAMEALKLGGSQLGGRAIEVEVTTATVDDDAIRTSAKAPSTHHPTTVFVSKFSKDVTSEDLNGMFSICGEVLEARVIVDKRTGASKCHGLVQFFEESSRMAALNLNKKNCNGHVLSVLPSKFGAVAEVASYYGPTGNRAENKTEQSNLNQADKRPATSSKSALSFRPRKLALQSKS